MKHGRTVLLCYHCKYVERRIFGNCVQKKLKRIIQDFLIYGFSCYGVLWIITESYGAFFEASKPEGLMSYAVLVTVSIVAGAWRCWPKNRIDIPVPNSDSQIEICFGDIFESSEAIAIPVNEFFDGMLGDHVSEKSLHGQFIKHVLGGQSSTFNELTNKVLKDRDGKLTERKNGRKIMYPIGTVATVDVNEVRYFLVALSKTNTETLKAFASFHELWDCLSGLWEGIRNQSNGKDVKIPLVGSGLSGVGLPERNLIEIILTSFFYYTKKNKIADKIILVLPKNIGGKVDLVKIERSWT